MSQDTTDLQLLRIDDESRSQIFFFLQYAFLFRDWSLITGRGGGYKTGGHVKFYPYENGGRKKF